MRYLILLLLLTSCGVFNPEKRAYKKAKRKFDAFMEIAKNNPALLDSFQIVKRDTVKTTELKEKLVATPVVDSSAVDSLARLYCASQPEVKPKIIKKLIRASCPNIKKDTTYHIKITNSAGASRTIPINLTLESLDGNLTAGIDVHSVQLPSEFTVNQVVFKPPDEKFYQNSWFWAFVGMSIFSLCMMYILLRK